MNKVILVGNLATEPMLRRTQEEAAVCSFRLAVRRRYTGAQGEKETDFFNVVAWRQLGELVHRYMHKGGRIAVVGWLQHREYTDQQGEVHRMTEIVADEVEFLSDSVIR